MGALRAALRPARPLRWVAGPAVAVLLVLLFALARLADGDPLVRISDDLAAAGFDVTRVSVEQAQPNDGEGDAAHVEVRFDSGAGAEADRQMGDRIAAIVWKQYDGRLGAVTVAPAGGEPRRLDSLALLELFGNRRAELHDERYSARDNRAGLVTALAAVAVLVTGLLVLCSSVAAFLVIRGLRRTPAAGR